MCPEQETPQPPGQPVPLYWHLEDYLGEFFILQYMIEFHYLLQQKRQE